MTAVRDVVGLSISDDLMLDGGIVEFLLGGTLPADAIASHGLAIDELVLEDASRKQIKGLTTAVSPSGAPRLLITLLGPASSGRRPVARALAQALGADIACRLLDLDDAGEEHFRQLRRWLRDRGWLPARRYQPHPDPRQEAFFFGLVKECLAAGLVSEDFVRRAVAAHDVRPDVFERIAASGDWKPLAS